jgi:hypothetical protein
MLLLLKMTCGFVIGRAVGKYIAKNELSPILGICLTVVSVLAACLLLDKGFLDVPQN